MAKTETIYDFIPGKYVNDVTNDLLWAFQNVFEELMEDVKKFPEIVDPDKCPPVFLDLMLEEMGFKLWEGVSLSTDRKRKLVKSLIRMYSQKGTKPGIENAIYFFLNLDVNVTYPYADDTWTLGESELGVTTELAPTDESDDYYYTLDVGLYEAVNPETETLLNKILAFMAPARFKWSINEPGQSELTYWTLGVSELGLNTVLNQ